MTLEAPDYAFAAAGDGGHQPGLTKRELFAVFSTQPGVAEIVTAAGFVYKGIMVFKDADTALGTFNDWWGGLTNEERFALSSKVRVQQADALLAALEAA